MAQHLINDLAQLREAVKELNTHDRLSCDTETKGPSDIGGLYPFHGSRAFSVIFATDKDEYYFNFNTGGINPKYIIELQPIFDNSDRLLFFVNAVFDATILWHHGIVIHCRIADCPSLARVEYNQHNGGKYISDESFLSLAYLAEYYGVQLKDDRVKKYIQENDLYAKDDEGNYIKNRLDGKKIPLYNLVPLDLMFEYGCGDARSTFDLAIKIIKCINYKDSIYEDARDEWGKMIDVAKNEIKLTTVLVDMKIKGAKLWVEYVEKAIAHEKEISLRLHKEIENLTGGINLNSGKQLAEFLVSKGVKVPRKDPTDNDLKMRDKWLEKRSTLETQLIYEGQKATKKTKAFDRKIASITKQLGQCTEKINQYEAGRYITDKKTLQRLMKKYPDLDFLSKITEAKEADKKISTYYGNFMKLKDANNIIHCGLNQEKAITGRFSSSDPNFQNLHKEKWDGSDDQFLIRKSIIAKDDNYDLFFFDYKGQEMYIMIDLAKDIPVVKDILENGTDIYIAMGNMVKEATGIEIDRQQAKALSLGVAYGQGKALIAKNLKCSIDEAQQLKEAFLGSLKGVSRLDRRMKSKAKYAGKIHNPYGRVSYIDEGFEYKALNSLIQGSAADCTKTAMVNVYDFLKKYDSHMILTVHDEIVFEIHEQEHHIIPQIQKIMSEAYPHNMLPLKVDIEYSKRSWGEKLEWEQN